MHGVGKDHDRKHGSVVVLRLGSCGLVGSTLNLHYSPLSSWPLSTRPHVVVYCRAATKSFENEGVVFVTVDRG